MSKKNQEIKNQNENFENNDNIEAVSANNPNKKSKVLKTVGVCALVGVCMTSSFFIGKEVGINSPATTKQYLFSNKLATVNGKEVPFKDFKASMNIIFHINKTKELSDEEISDYEAQFIEYSTLNKAIYDVAVKNKIKSDEESVKANYTSIMEQLKELLGMETDEILKKFKLNEDEILESLRQEYIVNLYLEQNSQITEEDALKYYNENPNEFYQYKASHILIPTTDQEGNELSAEEKEKAKNKALDLLKQIKNGANFEELAKLNSSDSSAESGGDLGYFTKGEMVEEFQKAVENCKTGALYPELVETGYGYHIIKRTGENTKSFDEEKEAILTQMSYDKKNEVVEKIKKEADIVIHYKY